MFARVIYVELQKKLFEDIKNEKPEDTDYLKHFFDLSLNKHVRRLGGINALRHKPSIQRGAVDKARIGLKPSGGSIYRSGEEFYNALLGLFNNRYCLPSLWMAMYSESKGSTIGAEITRAFIKNCISVASAQALMLPTYQIDGGNVLKHTSWTLNHSSFYRKAFHVKRIVQDMRKPERGQMFRHYKARKWRSWVDGTVSLDPNSGSAIADLFKRYKLEKFEPLVHISFSLDKRNPILEPVDAFVFFLRSIRNRGDFRRELKGILSGDSK
ncbi:MAG: hypothetical protein JJU31_09095 [Wenzhouxiangella sp.]|nr:hypothetical protein [Wenzhouxiangella sp.]